MSATSRRHWLCVAYAFPPINRSGTYRTLGFVNHLDRLGWDATVLTVDPVGEPVDESLLRRIPASTTVLRTSWTNLIERLKSASRLDSAFRADSDSVYRSTPLSPPLPRGDERGVPRRDIRECCKKPTLDYPTVDAANAVSHRTERGVRDWVSRLLMTPDSRLGWIAPTVRRGLQAMRQRRPSVIYSTSPYMSAHLVALLLNRRTRVPWVADFRDPWRGNPFRELAYASLKCWDAWLERIVLEHAAHVVCATPTMTDELCRRAPFVANKCTTILNGFDAEWFEGIEPVRVAPAGDFVLVHCGQFYGPRTPEVWLAALRRVAQRAPHPARRIHLALIGPETFNGRRLHDLAIAAGVADRVHILGVKTHPETLSYMAGSDALILAGPTGNGSGLQIPNKLFEYLALRRPILANLSRDNPAVSILERAGAVAFVCGPNDEDGIAKAIERFAAGHCGEHADAWTGVDQFERSRRASELAEIFRTKVSG